MGYRVMLQIVFDGLTFDGEDRNIGKPDVAAKFDNLEDAQDFVIATLEENCVPLETLKTSDAWRPQDPTNVEFAIEVQYVGEWVRCVTDGIEARFPDRATAEADRRGRAGGDP